MTQVRLRKKGYDPATDAAPGVVVFDTANKRIVVSGERVTPDDRLVFGEAAAAGEHVAEVTDGDAHYDVVRCSGGGTLNVVFGYSGAGAGNRYPQYLLLANGGVGDLAVTWDVGGEVPFDGYLVPQSGLTVRAGEAVEVSFLQLDLGDGGRRLCVVHSAALKEN